MSSVSALFAHLQLETRAEALQKLLPALHSANTFLITSHARPDGDAVGSALAMLHLLSAMGKQATVYLADAVPRAFQELPGAQHIGHAIPPDACFDVGIVLECDSVGRTGFRSLPCGQLLNIDHHQSGCSFADLNWIEPSAPAVGVLVFALAQATGASLSADLATCLYAALLTDTVGFTVSTLNAATFDLARQLLELGADAAGVTDAVYFTQAEGKLRLLGAALQDLQVHHPVAWTFVTQQQMKQVGAAQEDSEGIVQHLITLEGICAAALLRELPDGALRVSLRSRGEVDVARVAETFGGGGHRNASGCTLHMPAAEAASRLETALKAACSAAGHAGYTARQHTP